MGTGGALGAGTGGAAAGGSTEAATSGGAATGGKVTGGTLGTGGAATSGIGSGGIAAGGSQETVATGGTGTGGTETGGKATGGALGTGGAASGGAGSSGTKFCDGFIMPNPVASGLPNPAAYDTNVAGVVTDRVTGLMWIPSYSEATCLQDQAAAYCAANRTGDFSDWRVPTVVEFASIVDFTVAPARPPIDTLVFSIDQGERYWTSTPVAGNSGVLWTLDFYDGSPYPGDRWGSDRHNVLCVRVALPSCYPPPRFTVQGTGEAATVTDAATKLVWQQMPSSAKMAWNDATASCSSPFRLPSVNELQTIVDHTVDSKSGQYPMIDASVFPSTPADYFWTSSAYGGPGAWRAVDFRSGVVKCMPAGGYARCVRSDVMLRVAPSRRPGAASR